MVRKNPLPFGGIQLILTGDFLQLPPVKNNGFVLREPLVGLTVCLSPSSCRACSVRTTRRWLPYSTSFRRGVVDATGRCCHAVVHQPQVRHERRH